MLMPDVNVLIYAHREDEAVHRHYREWLEGVVNGPSLFALSSLVLVGFVRIVTNKKIYRTPTPIGLALATVETLVSLPNCRLLYPGPRHIALWATLCRVSNASGKMVADAQLAALAIEYGSTLVSRDSDFAVFAAHGLRWQHLNC